MLKLGTIGTSWITQSFIEGAKTAGGIEITACYSRDIEKAKSFGKSNGAAEYYDSIEAMATSSSIEAVYIASPNLLHYEQSKLFLLNGKNVLVEKPATSTLAQSIELFELAESKGLVYAEAIMSIHTPAFSLLKNEIKKIGKIRTANIVFCQLSSKYPLYLEGKNPNIFNPKLHTGCLMDIGVYNVYLAAALFGKPDKIVSDSVFLESGSDASGTAILSYGNKRVNLIYSKVGQSYSPSEIIGDEGTISIDSVSQLTGIERISKEERTCLIKHDIERREIMSGEAAFFRDEISLSNRSEVYRFAKETALTVREITDEIRKQNPFLF